MAALSVEADVTKRNKSTNHHWWPVGLQKYWTDQNGDLSWIDPDGILDKKKAEKRKIGYKRHGHTIFRDSVWESNFESDFDVDNEVHRILDGIYDLKPFGRIPSKLFAMFSLIRRRDRTLRDICKFYHLDEKIHRNLLLLLFSLLIRSPASRSRYEGYPSIVGLPPDEEVGKANMVQNYRIAKKLCRNGLVSNQYFVLLYSPFRNFIFGDGSLDWLTDGLVSNRINGRALVPLTPHICVYFCTPRMMRSTPNCASLRAAPWIVEQVNQIIQIYSKDKIFFMGQPPKLIDAFHQQRFLEHKDRTDVFIHMLDEVAMPGSTNGLLSTGPNER